MKPKVINTIIVAVALACVALFIAAPMLIFSARSEIGLLLIGYGIAPALVIGHVLLAWREGSAGAYLSSLLACAAALFAAYLIHLFGVSFWGAMHNTDRSTGGMARGFLALFATIGLASAALAALLASIGGVRAGNMRWAQIVLAVLSLLATIAGGWSGLGIVYIGTLAGAGVLALWWLSVAATPLLNRLAIRPQNQLPAAQG